MNFKFIFRILIFFLCFISTKQASIHIENSVKDIPIPKLLTNYHHFITTIEYLDTEYNNKSIEENINKMKILLERVPEILSNLLLCVGNINVNYNETLLKKFKIEFEKYNITEEKIKTDFLAIIYFLENNDEKNDISAKFSTKDGYFSAYYEKQRYIVGYIKINYNYNISTKEFEENFVINIIREIFRGI